MKTACAAAAGAAPIRSMCAYHDQEWGVPECDSRALFEKLLLDGFQAGLSWITILRKREAFRAAFDGFRSGKDGALRRAQKLEQLMQDAGIVRNRAKIEASVSNAQAYLAIPDFSAYLWDFIDGAAAPEHGSQHDGHVPAADAARREDVEGSAQARLQFLSGRPSSMPSCRPAGW